MTLPAHVPRRAAALAVLARLTLAALGFAGFGAAEALAGNAAGASVSPGAEEVREPCAPHDPALPTRAAPRS